VPFLTVAAMDFTAHFVQDGARRWSRMENSTARIPAYRPKLPCVEKLIPFLREIDKNRWYSNRGMLVQALEQRVTAMLGTGCGVAVAASGWA
jgi:hypothetical protein